MGKFRSPRVVPRERVRSPKFESRRVKLLRDGCACVARVKLGMRNVHRVHVTDIWSWYRVELRVGDHLGRSEELVSRCVECDLAEPESLASLGGSAPGVVDGILSGNHEATSQGMSQESRPASDPATNDPAQTPLEDTEVSIPYDDKLGIKEVDVIHAEEEGARTEEDKGAAHMENEGAGQVEEGGVIDNTGEDASGTRNNEETVQGSGYNLRPNRSREYSHRFDPQVYNVTNLQVPCATREPVTTTQKMFGFVFTQMTARAGIKKHGQAARDALTAEFAQLDYKGAYEPVHAADLTEPQRRGALRIINLIKEKRDGRLKGRSVADGRPQWALYTKEETSSPTATPESVLLTALIDAVEDRHVVVADVTVHI